MRSCLVLIVALVVGCSGGDDRGPSTCHFAPEGAIAHCTVDSSRADPKPPCKPLTQEGCNVGEKCTWLLDALVPDRVGHVGCAPSGTAGVGEACMFGTPGTTGIDNCVAGLICSADQGTGTCTQVCDLEGGDPQCGIVASCTAHASIFVTQGMPPTVGLCAML